MIFKKREGTRNWKKSCRTHSLKNTLWKRLWTCHNKE